MSEGHRPYLMPTTGQRLSNYLVDQGLLKQESPRRAGKKHRKASSSQQWHHQSAPRAPPTPASDLEAAELAALERVGGRRRRRFLNDKLLRDLAGPMSAHDMASLFAPAPFGEVKESALSVLIREQGSLWSHFLSIDFDKQTNVLEVWRTAVYCELPTHIAQRWEGHVRSSQPDAQRCDSSLHATLDAMQRWSRIPRRLRAALRGTDADVVARLELALLEAMHGTQLQVWHQVHLDQ